MTFFKADTLAFIYISPQLNVKPGVKGFLIKVNSTANIFKDLRVKAAYQFLFMSGTEDTQWQQFFYLKAYWTAFFVVKVVTNTFVLFLEKLTR